MEEIEIVYQGSGRYDIVEISGEGFGESRIASVYTTNANGETLNFNDEVLIVNDTKSAFVQVTFNRPLNPPSLG